MDIGDSISNTIAVVVVTHESIDDLDGLVKSVIGQLREGDELVLVDNASTDGTASAARALDGRIKVIASEQNLGFAGGCHLGASSTTAPLILLLNPDCRPEPSFLERLRGAGAEHPEWAAWQAAVLLDESRINTSGGVVHYLGIGWAGDCERPVSDLPSNDREIAFPSGAAMVVRREAWEEMGGLDRDYFMYGEDLDLGLRLWLAGRGVGLVPDARVTHGYEFDKGSMKWFWLERNRWRTVLSVYPAPLLLMLMPALLTAELGLLFVAAQGGWLASKVRAQIATIRDLPLILDRRRRVQSTRCIRTTEFASHLTASLDSPYLPTTRRHLIGGPQSLYWWIVQRILAL